VLRASPTEAAFGHACGKFYLERSESNKQKAGKRGRVFGRWISHRAGLGPITHSLQTPYTAQTIHTANWSRAARGSSRVQRVIEQTKSNKPKRE
jgi:hypothetical protein